MADRHPSATPHPRANPGYGKRSAPAQHPRSENDFRHLVPRDAAIAAYIDRLDDGADISIKTLAQVLPYGQRAVATSLGRITRAGHLRRGGEQVESAQGGQLWVTRTWWTRTPRDDAWWTAFRNGDVPEERVRATRTRAHILLAALGREAPVLSLSAGECTAMVPLVEEWFVRGASEQQLLHALTTGLPMPVHHPAGLVRRRLVDKLPPAPPFAPPPSSRRSARRLECSTCGRPVSAEVLREGDCPACRGEAGPTPRPSPLDPAQVRARAAEARAAAARAADAGGADAGGADAGGADAGGTGVRGARAGAAAGGPGAVGAASVGESAASAAVPRPRGLEACRT
ncbi:hypothetical protein [Streptomyces sp. CC77]|uniref:hypothetical protein n=1 Tax=Streptomyces sp. CC77 TaxID=1906739 RepID=UPI0008DD7A59|nr:hypothetical protein [Streptomyces sp. CC77]OII67514.1 hypothetical protein BJP39_24760 [Streptomyces sp. CC77]